VGVSPVVRRRRLAAELRRLRMSAQVTLTEVATSLECSPAKVRRIETGQVSVRIQDVREMLDCYRATDHERDALLSLARQARGRGWWNNYSDLISEELQTFIGLEDEASHICTYEAYFVPGLLQTERYSLAMMTAREDTPLLDIERGLELRMIRQQILDRPDAPHLSVLIDEGALRRPAGGRDVMIEQYNHLISSAERPKLVLQVIPFSRGVHPSGSFSFTILSFTDSADPKIAYAELLLSSHYTDKAEQVGRHIAEFEQLRSQALDAAETLAFLREHSSQLGR
jgi:transcriptional regulator with XRE-family HTH domain